MALYQLRTFSDIYTAIREEIQVQSSDTTALNRIKRDINIVYQDVVAEKNWWWLNGNVTLQLPAYISTGTASVTSGSATVTLSTSISGSKVGYYFAADGYNEIYRIESHTAGTATVKLDAPYNGTTATTATYKIWTDKLPLPLDCKETTRVWHDHYRTNMDALSLSEYRRLTSLAPRNEDWPRYYYTGDFKDPQETSAISSMPSLSTRASSGLVKTLVFGSALPSALVTSIGNGEPIKIRITAAGHYSYNGDFLISGVSTTSTANDTLTFIGTTDYQESAAADTTLTIRQIDQEAEYDRYRELFVYPSVKSSRTSIHVDYIKQAMPLSNDSDEPAMPLEDRVILIYGALHRAWSRMRNPEEAARNFQLYQGKLSKMAAKIQDSLDKPRLVPSKLYLSSKRNAARTRNLTPGSPVGATGGSSGAVVSSTPNTVAIFDENGEIIGSSTISTTELGYLNGVSSNLQTQLDAITTLADGKIYIGNGSNAATEVTPTGDVTISNSGVTAIGAGVIVDADISASAAITKTKIATGTASRVEVTDGSGNLTESAITSTELTYLDDVEVLTSFAMSDNQAAAANVATWTAASFDTIHIKYSLKRGTSFETGLITLTTDGTNASIAQGAVASIGTMGVTFTADVSAGSLRLRYTSTSTGTAPSMKYKLEKWLS